MIGGPVGDAGLTGRKIIVDTYGGFARHGGGAFSGKDPSKVDRSAAYAARYVAKNVVAGGLARRAEVQVAYAIGVARPVSVLIDTFGTERVARDLIGKLVAEHFDLRPAAFRGYLGLHAPIYSPTSAYGHFGRTDIDLPWERTDRAATLRAAAGLAPAACPRPRRWAPRSDLPTGDAAAQARPGPGQDHGQERHHHGRGRRRVPGERPSRRRSTPSLTGWSGPVRSGGRQITLNFDIKGSWHRHLRTAPWTSTS